MAFLQDEFKNHGYTDLLEMEIAADCEIDLEDIFDSEQKPNELLSIFISEQRDELLFVLDGDSMEINSLCDRWDDRIRVFTIINGKVEAIRKLKYNIVQLIIYSGDTPDKSREGNLLISRKIIIKGDLTNKEHIILDDDETNELPFHMIPTDAFSPDKERMNELRCLLPEDRDLLSIMIKPQKRVDRRKGVAVQPKSLKKKDYEKIKEWLER